MVLLEAISLRVNVSIFPNSWAGSMREIYLNNHADSHEKNILGIDDRLSG